MRAPVGSVESWEGREEGRSHRHSQRPISDHCQGVVPVGGAACREIRDIPRPIEDIPGAIETHAAPVPLPEAPDDPVDSGGDIEQTPETQEAEALTVTNTETCDEIADDEEWVMFSEDEAWVIGDSEDFEMFTAKNARSCTPSESP